MKVFIHTRDDVVLELREGTRPPKSYFRFRDLMQQTLVERPGTGLITLFEATVPRLLKRIGSDLSIGLSVQGKPVGLEALAVRLEGAENPAVLVGGFPKGHFTPGTAGALDELVRIDANSMDAHVVVARLVYEVEKAEVGPRP